MIKRLSAILVLVLALATPARASTLVEWDLPGDSAPVQIDGQHSGSLTFFFLDLGHSSINRVDITGGSIAVHDEWRPASFTGADPGTIEVDDTTGLVWVTDPPNGAIGMLDPAAGVYMWWRVQDVTGLPPVALALDKVSQQVWFTSYDGASTPVVGRLDPWVGKLYWWQLPASVADADDALDGLVAPSLEQVYFSVVGPNNRSITHMIDAFKLETWPIPLSEPGQIALTNGGRIAAALDNASAAVMLLDPGADEYTWWQDGLPLNSVSRWLSVLPGSDDVFFVGDTGPCVTWLDPSGGMPVSATPFQQKIGERRDSLGYEKEKAERSSGTLSPIISFPTVNATFAPFFHISPVTKLGAISVYNQDQVFITETNVSRVAWIIP